MKGWRLNSPVALNVGAISVGRTHRPSATKARGSSLSSRENLGRAINTAAGVGRWQLAQSMVSGEWLPGCSTRTSAANVADLAADVSGCAVWMLASGVKSSALVVGGANTP